MTNTTGITTDIRTAASFFSLEGIITVFTAFHIFIQVIRGIYGIQSSRYNELKNVIKDGVQFVWDTYVKERKEQGVWNNTCKNRATDLCLIYIKEKINLTGLVKKERLVRLIKEEVSYRKIAQKNTKDRELED